MKRTKRLVATLCSALVLTATVSMPASAHTAGSTPTKAAPHKGTVTTTSGNLNVRKTASSTATVVGSFGSGAYAHIIGKSGSWFKVYYNMSGSEGYASTSYMTQNKSYAKTTKAGVNLRASVSTSSGVRANIATKGTGVPYLNKGTGEGYSWNRVVYRTTTGYLRSDVSSY